MREKAVARKLLSDRGASLAYALLLFMVCSTVGIVVLTAGSASAGRISELAEMDSRYYAVTSAAGLLVDLFDGTSVTVTETVKDFYDTEGNLIETKYGYSVDSATNILNICEDIASYITYGEKAVDLTGATTQQMPNTEPVRAVYTAIIKDDSNRDIILWTDKNGNDISLDFNIEGIFQPNGALQWKVYNKSGDPFTLTILFDAQIVNNPPEESGSEEEGEKETKNIKKIIWDLKEINRKR